MKTLMTLVSCLIFSFLNLQAQDIAIQAQDTILEPQKETCTITIELTDLKSDEGQLMVALYSSPETWLGDPYKGELVKIVSGKATVVFTDVPYGVYAASAVHDEDLDNKLNTGLFGIPSEPYASSRGAKGTFGPPKWEDAKFNLSTVAATEQIKF